MLPESENNAAREFFLTLDTECRGQVPASMTCDSCVSVNSPSHPSRMHVSLCVASCRCHGLRCVRPRVSLWHNRSVP